MEKCGLPKTVCMILVVCVATAIASPAQTFTSLFSFNGTDGQNPEAGLVQGTGGNFYGTTAAGGAYNLGTVFKIAAAGTLTTLHSFDGTDGECPYGGLVQATNGSFFGMTWKGGAYGYGTVFKITAAGTLTTLHSFNYTDGAYPYAGLLQGTNGIFYGTTSAGGVNGGFGTVFKITAAGTLTTLYSFAHGEGPEAGLVQGTDGNFYGTTIYGGAYGGGTVFEITTSGTLTTLHSFDYTDSGYAYAGLVQGSDGTFYGTTEGFGFAAYGYGTVFEINAGGTLTTLYTFDSTDGDCPYAGLLQGTNGIFYGTTSGGGTSGVGTVFSLSMGLGTFVQPRLTMGEVGAEVILLGNNLTGATAVSFNGTAATFTAKSTEIKTKVPAGAATGTVTVTTASGGTLSSNVPFRVTPQLKGFNPRKGPVGTEVEITGESLTQTSGVSFGSVAATEITVVSDTEVTATVPSGAVAGTITITTLGGIATSTKNFTVTE